MDALLDNNVARLIGALENALAEAKSELPSEFDNPVFRQRLAAIWALDGVVNYLDEIGVDQRLRGPLINVWMALADAGRGIGSPMLAPEQKATDAARKPSLDVEIHAAAAAAVTLYKKSGLSLDDALNTVARVTAPHTSCEKLRDIRKRMTRGRKVKDEMRGRYEQFLATAQATPMLTPRQRADAALKLVRAVIVSKKVG